MPSTKEGIEGFLSSGLLKGIGKKTAATIVGKFGEETFDIIENHPERLTEVDGIGKKKAEAITQAFAAHKEFAEISLYFQQFGITAGYAMRLYKVYGGDTIKEVKENPYQLVDDVGIGFKSRYNCRKDRHQQDSEYRIKSGIKYVLLCFVNEGNTYVPQKAFAKTAEILMLARAGENLVEMALMGMHIENLEGRVVFYSLFHGRAKCLQSADILEQCNP